MFTQNKSNRRTTAFKSVVVGASVMIGLVLASSPVHAASACKGLDNNACGTSTSCTWVKGYERKDGRSVSAFCRAKASSKSSAKPSQSLSKVNKSNSKK